MPCRMRLDGLWLWSRCSPQSSGMSCTASNLRLVVSRFRFDGQWPVSASRAVKLLCWTSWGTYLLKRGCGCSGGAEVSTGSG
jgi:hypothetical protein